MTRRKKLVISAVLVAAVAGVSQAGHALIISRPLDSPDAVVSLASHEWERLPDAAAVAKANPAAVLILTEPEHPTIHNCHRCAERVADLAAMGVRRERIRLVRVSAGGTEGEALAVRAFATQTALHRLLIVTSPYHTRRAFAAFRSAFRGSPVTLGVLPSTNSPARPGRWWTAGYDRWYVGYESLATVFYLFRYGVAPW